MAPCGRNGPFRLGACLEFGVFDVAVTGASGFLGRAVVGALRRSGRSVAAVSRRPGKGLVTVSDYRETPAAPVIVHLAETSDRAAANGEGEATVSEAVNRVRALIGDGRAHIVLGSSVVVYGERGVAPFSVGDPTPADDAYARAKLASESVVREAGGAILRLSNVYGPGMARHSVLSDILAQIPGEGPLEVRDATPERDFLWIDDAAAAFVAAVVEGPAAAGTWNVASGRSVAIGRLAAMALAAAGEAGRPVRSLRPGAGGSVWIDIEDTVSRFDWRPSTSLEEGIGRLVGAGRGRTEE